MENFGKRLKARRNELHMTQAELAKEANVSRESIVNYENGRRKIPNADIVNRLASAMNDTGWWLATGEGFEQAKTIFEEVTGKQSTVEYVASSPEQRITVALMKLNDDGKEHVADYAEMLTYSPDFKNPDYEEHESP